MRGVVFTGERGLELMQFPDPAPDAHEVVIEMKASGMCGSDLHQYRRPKGQTQASGIPMRDGPVIAGHEPCGVVVAVGTAVDAREAQIGARVMVHHYQGCTQCNHCRSGWQQLCQEVPVKVYGNNAHGGHAQYLKVPANTLVPLPDQLSFAAGAAIACGSGTAYAALRRMNLSGNDTIAIFGQGPVGLAATQYARAMGARVIALDISQQRLDQPRLERSGRRDQGPHPRALRGPDAGYLEQPRGATERDPQHKSVGHDVLCRRRRRCPYRRQPASAAPAIDAGGIVDVLQYPAG
jgi:D-arabinose 1-dehydrogenase-like Zn-dependent alcohol dehydrogenase